MSELKNTKTVEPGRTGRRKYATPRLTAYGTLAELTGMPTHANEGEDTGTGNSAGSVSGL